jgi:hypothetical protein
MTQFSTYEQVGIKEDVSDVISNISPTKTPFTSLVKGKKHKAKKIEWQEEDLRAVADNAKVEGFVAASTARTPTEMKENVTQILSDTIDVAATSDEVDTYGRAREIAHQLHNVSKELKRDLEHAYVGTGQAMVAGDKTTARKFAGVQNQIHADVTITIDSDAGTAGDQAGPLTETALLDANENLYDEGSEATVIMVKPRDARVIADFGAASGRTRDLQGKTKLVNVVDLYVSPYGEQKVVINRFIRATDALIFDPSMWERCYLRNWQRETLAKIGDSTRIMVVGEFSLRHKNEKGSALITNLS